MAGKGNTKYSDCDVVTDPATGCRVRPGCRHRNGYVKRTVNSRGTYAHIAAWETVHGPVPKGYQVDHTCRNRACENVDHLRLATRSQQQGNRGRDHDGSSRFKGVSFAKAGKPWRAQIAGEHIGSFEIEEDAARAYDQAARNRWGEFALTNFSARGEDRL